MEGHPQMNSKAYSARNVNQVCLASYLEDHAGLDVWIGMDIGKQHIFATLTRGAGEFERPWKINNPAEIRVLIEHFKQLAARRGLIVAMEPSGTYGDPLRQACTDAGIEVHRVSPKAAKDYAEVFDGVPSQHDGKDAAVLAELARLGKSVPWPWKPASPRQQQIEYWVDRMDESRRLMQMWCGRIEGRLGRHWPEILPELKLTASTLLGALAHHGGPAALAADPRGRQMLRRLSRNHLSDQKIDGIIEQARQTVGVRQTAIDHQRLRDYARWAMEAKDSVKQAKTQLRRLSNNIRSIQAMTPAIGNATACVLWRYLGEAKNYHCGAAYVKAMGMNLTERSSGMYRGKLRISKRGHGVVRYWMYLAGLRLIKKNSPVRRWYLQKKHRDSDQAGRALVGIMRRLGLGLYQVAVNGEAFDARRLFPGQGKAGKRATPAKGD
jgi:transposase